MLEASVQRPSNIAVYFTVDTSDGVPVAGLTAESFKIYEDDHPVSVLESKQTLLEVRAYKQASKQAARAAAEEA